MLKLAIPYRNRSLHSMPADLTAKISQIKSHLFFVMGGQVVIVDPKNNEIVDVIK